MSNDHPAADPQERPPSLAARWYAALGFFGGPDTEYDPASGSYRAVPRHWHEVHTEIVPCPAGDCFWNEPDCGVPDIDREPPAAAADWLEVSPADRHPYGSEPEAS